MWGCGVSPGYVAGEVCTGEKGCLRKTLCADQHLQTVLKPAGPNGHHKHTHTHTQSSSPLVSPSQQKVCRECDVVVSVLAGHLGQLLQRASIPSTGGHQQQPAVVLGVVETLERNAKLAERDGQISQLLPLLFTLWEDRGRERRKEGGMER